ncbi:Bacterial extracellular solute-binding protein, family 3 [Corynebacterium occultum]|uniref:Bacterial extracellular solute-binding protein, family 3 n=1 Tax=Corynebacterium occultum TaxID=2675219 RepID=A0A6B8VZ54_9CORY|nr:transporter substrate-binding domain-containing protein [Corynebacterium occultum]QGU06604.1 Bacterial extracellular solute-binding protein, family 3 [Corynebacterium occultum]
MPRKSLITLAALSACCSAALSACISIPADSIGTLERARDGTLVVGVSEHHPWTDVSEDGEYSGSEVDLIEGFAESINSEIEWHTAPESVLAGQIKEDELDIIIGGLAASSPWMTHMALTRPYAKVGEEDMVMGVRLGENALLVALERHLAQEHGEI